MKRALLVIDVQNEYITGKLPISYPPNSFSNILKVVDAANEKNIPVILIQHTSLAENAVTFKKGSNEWNIHPEILNKKHTQVVEKNLPGGFTNTNLEAVLKDLGIDTVTIAGL